MRTDLRRGLLGCAAVALACFVYIGCDDSLAIKEPHPSTRTDAGQTRADGGEDGLDAGTLPDGAPKDCFDNPKTHFEIINACTNATRIVKNPTLPKLASDGGLPPLE